MPLSGRPFPAPAACRGPQSALVPVVDTDVIPGSGVPRSTSAVVSVDAAPIAVARSCLLWHAPLRGGPSPSRPIGVLIGDLSVGSS